MKKLKYFKLDNDMIIMFKPLNFFYARREDTKMGIKILQIIILILVLIEKLLKLFK